MGQGIYEYPGHALILEHPFQKIPDFVRVFYGVKYVPWGKWVFDSGPTIAHSADMIAIDSENNKFEFSKKAGTLEKLTFYKWDDDDNRIIWKTYWLSKHVERSGVWLPLHIIHTQPDEDDRKSFKGEFSVAPEALLLLDTVEDLSIFTEAIMPAGCVVRDEIRKVTYMVPTADEMLDKWETWVRVFKKRLKQVQEHKDTIRDGVFLLWLLSRHVCVPGMPFFCG
jgi:hypothetical protein